MSFNICLIIFHLKTANTVVFQKVLR
uniref:Uncharacterized protein n=1 Tax=Wuchereria bancrofti TaxID=6293 RepID=A0AAF5PXG9_WUCBA